jgi:hypothetical protein
MPHGAIAQDVHQLPNKANAKKVPGELRGKLMPQTIYSSLYSGGQTESKTLLTVKGGCLPVCYSLQKTSEREVVRNRSS